MSFVRYQLLTACACSAGPSIFLLCVFFWLVLGREGKIEREKKSSVVEREPVAKWALVRVNEIALGLSTNRPSRSSTFVVTVYLSCHHTPIRVSERLVAVLGGSGLAIARQSGLQALRRS